MKELPLDPEIKEFWECRYQKFLEKNAGKMDKELDKGLKKFKKVDA